MGPSLPGRIPWSVIHLWCEAHGYDETDAELLRVVMGEMDGVFLEDYRAKMPKGGKGEGA